MVTLNLEGEICPYPLILTLRKVEEMGEDLAAGRKILEVTTDHPVALETIPIEIRKRGFSVEIQQIGAAKWKMTIKK